MKELREIKLRVCTNAIFAKDREVELFHDGGSNDTETSLLICSANQWTGFYMIGASIMRESRHCQASIMKWLLAVNYVYEKRYIIYN